MTEEQRQENKKIMTMYMSVAMGVLFMYYFGYVGSLCYSEHMDFFNALGNAFVAISEFRLLYPINVNAIMGILCGVICIPVLYLFLKNDSDRNNAYKDDEVAGTGGFMNKKQMQEYNQKYIEEEPQDPKLPSPNMIMSNSFRRPINSRLIIGNNNVLVVGGAGTGKSRFFIKPNILQLNSSYVVTDPSGEIIYSLGDVLTKAGYKIKVFNISDMEHSNCYNPLHYIRNEAGVNMVIDCLINNTTNGKDEQDFWVKAEKLLYSACIYYLKEFATDESKKNFPAVMNMVNASAVDENNPNAKSPLDELFEALPKSSLAWKYYKAFKQAAGKTLKSIIISCVTRLQPFMTPQVVNLTRQDNLELEKIGDEKTALFIITPQADRTFAFLASMLYSQLFETLYYIGEQQKANGGSEQLKVPVRCMMDEFANIGTVPEFPSKLSTMRKYNISATIVLQDIAQIEAMYQDDWKTLVGNCSSIVFLGSSEPNTLKYFSDMLGKKTVTSKSRGMNKGGKSGGGASKNFQQTGREVMTPDEIGRMNPKDEIVFTMNLRPVLDEKFHYEKHIRYSETADCDPSKAFLYNKMPDYDNSRPMHINSMLKARSETKRILAQKNVTDPISANDYHLQGDAAEALNNMILDKKKVEVARHGAVDNCIEEALKYYQDPVCIFKMESIPPKELIYIARQVAKSIGKNKLILFTELNNYDELTGIGIDFEGGRLYAAMDNKYKIRISKKSADGSGEYIFTVISKKVLDAYRAVVNGNFPSESAPQQETSKEEEDSEEQSPDTENQDKQHSYVGTTSMDDMMDSLM